MRKLNTDFFGVMLLMAVLLALNGGINFKDPEVLLRILIVGIIVLVIILYIYFEILPVAFLKLGRMTFNSEGDLEQYEAAIEAFFNHRHPKEKEYVGWLYRSELELYNGNYLDALDTLVNIEKKDLQYDRQTEIKTALLKCKIMMFLKNLHPDNVSWQFLKGKTSSFDAEDAHDFTLISCRLNPDKSERTVREMLVKLEAEVKASPNAERYRRYNEFLWLHGLQARKNNDEEEIIRVHNQLIINHAMKYLMSSFKSEL
ncbi:MAG: hypothetical protein IJM15_08640 [Erysipelotrichaceae bacterium]|nr:hypothetical protein [Erysipelotrichaceae bacterium]